MIAPFRVVVPVPFKIRALVPTLIVLAIVTMPSPETDKFALPSVIEVPVNVKLPAPKSPNERLVDGATIGRLPAIVKVPLSDWKVVLAFERPAKVTLLSPDTLTKAKAPPSELMRLAKAIEPVAGFKRKEPPAEIVMRGVVPREFAPRISIEPPAPIVTLPVKVLSLAIVSRPLPLLVMPVAPLIAPAPWKT